MCWLAGWRAQTDGQSAFVWGALPDALAVAVAAVAGVVAVAAAATAAVVVVVVVVVVAAAVAVVVVLLARRRLTTEGGASRSLSTRARTSKQARQAGRQPAS